MVSKQDRTPVRRLCEKLDSKITHLEKKKDWGQQKEETNEALKLFTQTRMELVRFHKEWKETRQTNIKNLTSIAEAMEKTRTDANISEVAGASASLVGGILTVAGLITMPFTVGATTPLLIAGLSVGIPGAVTGAGAAIADHFIEKSRGKEAAELIKNDEQITKDLLDFAEKVARLGRLLLPFLKDESRAIETTKVLNEAEIKDLFWDVGLPSFNTVKGVAGRTKTIVSLSKLVKASENLTSIPARQTLDLVNPVPFVKAADKAVASNTKLLATTGSKALYGLSWAAAGVFAILDIRTLIYKSRHIDLYRKKQNGEVDDIDVPEKSEDPENSIADMLADAIVGYITDPFLDMTISKRAQKLRQYVKFLQEQEEKIGEHEVMQQLLRNEEWDEVQLLNKCN